jgi:hypothetical protein
LITLLVLLSFLCRLNCRLGFSFHATVLIAPTKRRRVGQSRLGCVGSLLARGRGACQASPSLLRCVHTCVFQHLYLRTRALLYLQEQTRHLFLVSGGRLRQSLLDVLLQPGNHLIWRGATGGCQRLELFYAPLDELESEARLICWPSGKRQSNVLNRQL